MKVHLIRDFSVAYYFLEESKEIFDKVNGPIEFIYHKNSANTLSELWPYGSKYVREYELYKKNILEPNQLFETCQFARKSYNIPDDDIVILLTAFNNSINWFSMFQNKDAFVFIREWDTFLDAKEIYPVVHQILENLFQILGFQDINHLSQYIHQKPIACINDFCVNKSDIIFKIHSGNICKNCLSIAQKEIDNKLIINQIINLLHLVRDAISGYADLLKESKFEYSIKITSNYDIIIREIGQQIKLSPGEKTLYFFFLKHQDGFEFIELSDHYQEIYGLYSKFSPAANLLSIQESSKRLVNPLDNAFNEKLSKIKAKFRKLIPEEQARYYIPMKKAGDMKYKINVDRNQIDFPDHYLA